MSFKSYKIPKYTKYLNAFSNSSYHGILYKELCSKCGYAMGLHNNVYCPNGTETYIDHAPEFYNDKLNKNIKIL